MISEFVFEIILKIFQIIAISLFIGYLWLVWMLLEVGTVEAYGLIAIFSILVIGVVLMYFLQYIT